MVGCIYDSFEVDKGGGRGGEMEGKVRGYREYT